MAMVRLGIPVWLFLLDLTGVGLAGVGLGEWMGQFALIPAAWRFPHYAETMVFCGAVLLLLMPAYLLRREREKRERPRHGGDSGSI